jgi:hypothetical protein
VILDSIVKGGNFGIELGSYTFTRVKIQLDGISILEYFEMVKG